MGDKVNSPRLLRWQRPHSGSGSEPRHSINPAASQDFGALLERRHFALSLRRLARQEIKFRNGGIHDEN
jgi:hypothetical protein